MRKFAFLLFALAVLFFIFKFAFMGQETVPDLSGDNWSSSSEEKMAVNLADGTTLLVYSSRMYSNPTENFGAVTFEYKGNVFAMLFGKLNDDGSGVRAAIRIEGEWYLAKEKGISKLRTTFTRDKDGKPTGIKLMLETTQGSKDLVLEK